MYKRELREVGENRKRRIGERRKVCRRGKERMYMRETEKVK